MKHRARRRSKMDLPVAPAAPPGLSSDEGPDPFAQALPADKPARGGKARKAGKAGKAARGGNRGRGGPARRGGRAGQTEASLQPHSSEEDGEGAAGGAVGEDQDVLEEEEEEEEELQGEGLFGEWQTELYVPPTVVDGVLPKNDRGIWDVWTHWHIPKVFIPSPLSPSPS